MWAYDLGLKRTAAGPASMAACRAWTCSWAPGEQVRPAVRGGTGDRRAHLRDQRPGPAEVTGAARGTAERALVASTAAAGLAAASCVRNGAAARAGAGVLIAGYLACPRSRRGYGPVPTPRTYGRPSASASSA